MILGFAFDSFAANLGLIAGIIVAIGVIWSKGIVPAYRITKAVTQAVETLSDIAKEFEPNEGVSLRDTVDRIERKVDGTAIIANDNRDAIKKLTVWVTDNAAD